MFTRLDVETIDRDKIIIIIITNMRVVIILPGFAMILPLLSKKI